MSLLAFDFAESECREQLFRPVDATLAAGALQLLDSAATCPNHVGVALQAGRKTAALSSVQSMSELLSHAAAAKAMTVELWLRMEPSVGTSSTESLYNLAPLEPILVFGSEPTAKQGLSGSGCDDGQYAFMIARQGPELRIEVSQAVRGLNGEPIRPDIGHSL